MQIALKILSSIALSLLTEKIFKQLIATALEVIAAKTETQIDDKILGPIIEELRK